MPPTILTMAEVSSLTRKSIETLRFYRKTGTGPKSFRLGRTVVYDQADVIAWIEEQRAADDPTAVAWPVPAKRPVGPRGESGGAA